MRVFATQAMWDAKEGKWYEEYSVDQESVTQEEYFRELETEQCLEDEEETFCKCCECGSEDCMDFNCTCDDLEVEDDDCEPCQCETCCEARSEYDEEKLCFCEECNKEREHELIQECLDFVFDPFCPEGVVDMVISTLLKFKELGKLEAKQDMKDFLED